MSFPAGVSTTTLIGKYISAQGDPVEGELIFTPTTQIKHIASNTIISAAAWSVQLRGDGSFSIELPVCQPNVVPDSFLYHVQEKFDGQVIREWNVRLDESLGPVANLVALSPAAPPTLANVYPTLADVASVASALDESLHQGLDDVNVRVDGVLSTLDSTVRTSQIGVAVPPLQSGKIPPQYLPPIPQGNYYPVSSQAAMLALNAVRGDYALRSDVNKTYVLSTDTPSDLASWLELPSGGTVSSVNGKAGAVVLSYLDVNASPATHTHTTLSGLTSLNVTALTASTSSTVSASFGGSSSLRTLTDTAGSKLYDGTGVLWYEQDHATRQVRIANGSLRLAASGQSTISPTLVLTTPTITTVSASVWNSQQIIQMRDARTANYGTKITQNATWDSVSALYTAASVELETAQTQIGSVVKSSKLTMAQDGFAWNLTSTAGSTSSLTLSNSAVANGKLTGTFGQWQMVLSDSATISTPTFTVTSPTTSFSGNATIGGTLTVAGKSPVLNTDTGTVTGGFTISVTGMTDSGCSYRVRNGVCTVTFKLSSTGYTLAVAADGVASDTVLAVAPAGARPSQQLYTGGEYSSAGAGVACALSLLSNGNLVFQSGTNNRDIVSGSVIVCSFTFLV